MRDYDRPPIAFTCIGGLFALLMLLGQMHLTSQGVRLANVTDIADPDTYMQIAMAE